MRRRKQHEFRNHFDDDIQWWSALDGVPSDEDNALEADMGMKLPPEYRRFQRLHGAVLVAASEDVWPAAEEGKSGPYWTFLRGFMILGLGDESPDNMDIRAVAAGFHQEFSEAAHLVPFFAYVDDADFHCFDQRGAVHFWSHEAPGESERQEVGFDEFVIAETKKLVARKHAVKDAVARYGKKWRSRARHPEPT